MNSASPQLLIKKLREAGLTQMQIQQHTGISQSVISRILSGKHKDPRISTVRALEDLLDTLEKMDEDESQDDHKA